MTEPIITPTAATLVAANVSVPLITAFGMSTGLRPDVLMAGFAGALAAIILLNSVPSEGDTWQHLIRSTFRRMAVALASSLVAGYLTPMALVLANLPAPLLLGGAFAVGGGAQKVLLGAMRRINPAPADGGQQA